MAIYPPVISSTTPQPATATPTEQWAREPTPQPATAATTAVAGQALRRRRPPPVNVHDLDHQLRTLELGQKVCFFSPKRKTAALGIGQGTVSLTPEMATAALIRKKRGRAENPTPQSSPTGSESLAKRRPQGAAADSDSD